MTDASPTNAHSGGPQDSLLERVQGMNLKADFAKISSIALAVATSLTDVAVANPRLPTCNLQHLTRDCAAQARAGFDLRGAQAQDTGVVMNIGNIEAIGRSRFETELKKMTRRHPVAEQRTMELSDALRRDAIEALRGSLRSEALSADSRAMIQRLETVRIEIVDSAEEFCSERVREGFPNAAYLPETHQIQICPAMAKLDPGAIRLAIAHELGHVVSGCNMEREFYLLRSRGDLERECTGDPEEAAILRERLDGVSHMVAYGGRLETSLRDCGMLETEPSARSERSTTFADLNQCVQSRYRSRYDLFVRANTTPLPGQSRTEAERLRETFIRDNSLTCFGPCDEHHSDAFAGMLMGRWAARHNPSADEVRRSLHLFSGLACREEITGRPVLNRDIYPTPAERLATMMSDRHMQAALGCSGTQPQICSLDGFTAERRSVDPRPASSAARPSGHSPGASPGQTLSPQREGRPGAREPRTSQ